MTPCCGDKQVRAVVEAKFADTLHRYAEHLRKLDAKLEVQREVGAKTQQRYQEVQGMLQVRVCVYVFMCVVMVVRCCEVWCRDVSYKLLI
jgi:hypothetical protein